MKKILAFSGSNSSKSINQQLIKIVAEYIEGADVEIIDLRKYPAVVYSIDEEEQNGFPPTMVDLHQKMKEADGYIVSTPEHNGFIPAVLKNTIDWLSRQGRKVFNEKPAVFLSASPGARGGASALNQLITIMPYQGADVIGGYSIGGFFNKVVDGKLVDEQDKTEIKKLLSQLVDKI